MFLPAKTRVADWRPGFSFFPAAIGACPYDGKPICDAVAFAMAEWYNIANKEGGGYLLWTK